MDKEKLIRCFVGLCMILFFFGISDKRAAAQTTEQARDVVGLIGIMKEQKDGAFITGAYATREELAYMLVKASAYAAAGENYKVLQLFSDVPSKDRNAEYIQKAAMKGYMSGYSDGKFRPKKAATRKEAIYGTLGILGYTKEDFAGKVSSARYDTFQELGLAKNLSLRENDRLTQADCITIFYNLLNAKQKSGEIYGKTLGYALNEDSVIDYNSVLKMKTKGPLMAEKGWEKQLSQKLEKYKIILGERTISPKSIPTSSILYYAEEAGKIWVYDQKILGSLEAINESQSLPQELVVAGTAYAIEKPDRFKVLMKNNGIQKGMNVVLLLGRDSKVAAILPLNKTLVSDQWQRQTGLDSNKAVIYKNDKEASQQELNQGDIAYFNSKLNTIWVYDKKISGLLQAVTMTQGQPQEFTIAGVNYTVENPKEMKISLKEQAIRVGAPVVLQLGREDKVAGLVKLEGTLAQNNWQQKLTFSPKDGLVYKNGWKAAYEDIGDKAAIYYSNELKTLWVYDKKAYGVLETINPSAADPEEIVVAGKSYDLKTQQPIGYTPDDNNLSGELVENPWGKRLRENGVKEGDNVVLLFGYNNKVIDIQPISKMPVMITGYVLGTQNKVVKNQDQSSGISRILRVVDTDSVIREFPCEDTSIDKGAVVLITFQNTKPVITKAALGNRLETLKNITSKEIAADARLLEIKDQSYHKLTVAQLKQGNYNADNIVYAQLNSKNEITDLIVKNVTDSLYQYGLLKTFTLLGEGDTGFAIQYTFDLGGTEVTMTSDTAQWNVNPGPRAIYAENGKIKDMQALEEVPIAYISEKQANTGDAVYQIADNAAVYFYKNGEYYVSDLEHIGGAKGYRIRGYKRQQGSIRVIIASN